MGYEIKKVDVWSAEIPDQPGGLRSALVPLVELGANLDFLLARRTTKGKGVVFLSPLEGAQLIKKAKSSGFSKNKEISALKIIGPDKAGLGLAILNELGSAGINIRGISASAISKNCVIWLAFDNTKDSAKALRILKKILATK
ncbi:MAG: amino acid-binding protein [Candidatus Hydrogenedens sp.]|nr:amino acid-binding protein [Candidatus Hydrogenedens sp.]